ncbi:MAG: tetratricopeptide repeat protein [Alphaproteobacteria bacterium]|nr:tetratricopeptide repeat protein [Alphaproteobacteria bacterium]
MAGHDDSRDDTQVQRVKVVGITHAPLDSPPKEALDDKGSDPDRPEIEIVGPTFKGVPDDGQSEKSNRLSKLSQFSGQDGSAAPERPEIEAPGEDELSPESSVADTNDASKDVAAASSGETPTPAAIEPEKSDTEKGEQRLREGLLRHQAGDLAAAEAIYREVITENEESADAQHLLGLVLHLTARNSEAEPHLRRAIALRPQAPEFHNSFGAVMIALGRHEEAYTAFEAALAIRDDLADAHYNLGYLDHAAGRLRKAVTRYRQSLEYNSDHVPAMINWGSVLMDQDRLKDANSLFQRALKTNPGSIPAIKSKARVCRSTGNLSMSQQLFRKAIELSPDDADAHFGLGETLLLEGDYRNGFEEYEWRLRLPTNAEQPNAEPIWNGASLDRKSILVRTGTLDGETVQFARYASFLAAKGARVAFACPAQLCRLIETVAGVGKAYKPGDDMPAFDYQVPLLSLPRLLGMATDDVPTGNPYLSVPEGLDPTLPPQANPRMRVGLIWRAGSAGGRIDKTAFPLERMLELATMPGLGFVSLQMGLSEEEAALLRARDVADAGSGFSDLAEQAATINALDLVISTDAPAAHIAGALGRPVWLLIRSSAHWAWLRDRQDSPWYPSMRIFRQDTLGDWSNIARRLPVTLAIEAGKKADASA